ncbi:DUF2235 domain-containing protein [Massilia antarctica]|uniref:DUF2235 domain-containing protein n=2 Tax=Massilia antarctica TaxID=2765360 RepID=A0AA48WLW8_9BURK|nr:DUF2235 domain-containing protein [Massilia antarctica]
MAPLKWGTGSALYLNGVGSRGTKFADTFDGATGTGTSERIRDAYRFLAERYEAGDRIFGFGFSRGAFALRSLVGFIEAVGLPQLPSLIKDDELFRTNSYLYGQHPARNRQDEMMGRCP